MNYDLQDADLSTVPVEGRLVADETKRAFSRLSAEQANWKPSEAEWSIGQCFEHLIITNRGYFPTIEEIREGRRRRRAWERMPLLPRFLGRFLIRTLRADSGRKVKVVHEQNHFVQARRVMESRGFPGARADRRQPGS